MIVTVLLSNLTKQRLLLSATAHHEPEWTGKASRYVSPLNAIVSCWNGIPLTSRFSGKRGPATMKTLFKKRKLGHCELQNRAHNNPKRPVSRKSRNFLALLRLSQFPLTLCKGIQVVLGFQIPAHGIPDPEKWIPDPSRGCWIPNSWVPPNWIQDSGFHTMDSGFLLPRAIPLYLKNEEILSHATSQSFCFLLS